MPFTSFFRGSNMHEPIPRKIINKSVFRCNNKTCRYQFVILTSLYTVRAIVCLLLLIESLIPPDVRYVSAGTVILHQLRFKMDSTAFGTIHTYRKPDTAYTESFLLSTYRREHKTGYIKCISQSLIFYNLPL